MTDFNSLKTSLQNFHSMTVYPTMPETTCTCIFAFHLESSVWLLSVTSNNFLNPLKMRITVVNPCFKDLLHHTRTCPLQARILCFQCYFILKNGCN